MNLAESDLLDFTSEALQKTVERNVMTAYEDDEHGDDDIAVLFETSAKIQALVALTDPVGQGGRAYRGVSSNKWNYAPAYYVYAANYKGNHVNSSVDVESVYAKTPRIFDAQAYNPVTVRKKNYSET